MARPGVDYDDVARIARQLISQGESPSVQKVRDRLKTGSNTTIATHLKTWRASFVASKSPALPESVPEDLMNPLDDFWNLAVAKAETNYQKYKAELEAKLEVADAEKQLAINQLVEKTQEVDTLTQSLTAVENTLQDTEQQWHTLKGEHAVTASELRHAHVEMERIHALLRSQKQAFESEREQLVTAHEKVLQFERERATTSENRLLLEIDQLRTTIKTTEAEKPKQQKDFQEFKDQSRQHELALQQELSTLKAEKQHLQTAQQQELNELDTVKKQLSVVQGQLSKSLDTIEALRQSLEQARDNETQLTERIEKLKEMVAQLESSERS